MAGKNEQIAHTIKVRPEAIRIRKDNLFSNVRTQFPKEDLQSLEKSIREIGLLEPPTVERDPSNLDEFILVAGERRHLCITSLKNKNIACRCLESQSDKSARIIYEFIEVRIVVPTSNLERLQIMIAENNEHVQVPDWDYMELCQKLETEIDEEGEKKYDRKDLSVIFNRCPAWISHSLSLSKMPAKVQEYLKCGKLSRTAAVDLLSAKPDQVEFILKHAEAVVIRNARNEKEKAQEEIRSAEYECEVATIEQDHALSIGDRLAEKIAQRKGSGARQKMRGAEHREEKAIKILENPIITEEAVIETFEENPSAIKENVTAKPRSPKRMRDKLREYQQMLELQKNKEYIVSQSGQQYPREHVLLVIAAYEQMMGKKPLDIFDLLNEEYSNWNNNNFELAAV